MDQIVNEQLNQVESAFEAANYSKQELLKQCELAESPFEEIIELIHNYIELKNTII
jgi:translation initiation factor 2 alpha subunit (eIF-2alpha)